MLSSRKPWLIIADNSVPIGMSSGIYRETVQLLERLMQERGIPIEYHTFRGEKSPDTPLIGTPR